MSSLTKVSVCWNYNHPGASGRVFFCLHCLFSFCCLLSSAYCLSRSPTAFFVIHSHSTETFLFYYYYYIYSYIFTPTPQTLSPNRMRHWAYFIFSCFRATRYSSRSHKFSLAVTFKSCATDFTLGCWLNGNHMLNKFIELQPFLTTLIHC